jgi:hypothetical protein
VAISSQADKATVGLKHLGPVSDDVYLYLVPQLQYLHQMALYFAVSFQAEKPGSAVQKLAMERNKSVRLFDPDLPPIDPEMLGRVTVSSKDLPPPVSNLIRMNFECYDQLLEARHEKDEHRIWLARSEERKLRQQVRREIDQGNIPHYINVLLDVAERIASSSRKQSWQTALKHHVGELVTTASPTPPRYPGA